jgi:hypothetical protein
MKALITSIALAGVIGILSGCSTVTVPAAQRYLIRVQDNPSEMRATSVRLRGEWIVVETDNPPETQLIRRSSVVWIRALHYK